MKALGLLVAIVTLGMWASAAYGDGGSLLLHQDAGPFTITLFAAPQPLTSGEADLSVMVQERSSGDVLLDPVVEVTATPADGKQGEQTVQLATGNSANRLLQTGRIPFARPGRWWLRVHVRGGRDQSDVSTECTVQPDTSRARIVWFYALLPVAIILLFLWHQFLQQKQTKGARGR